MNARVVGRFLIGGDTAEPSYDITFVIGSPALHQSAGAASDEHHPLVWQPQSVHSPRLLTL